jgi:hypothetical protein
MKKIYLLALTLVSAMSFGQVVISQVYGGGGNSGATYTNDFIELFNRGTVAQSLNGWSVQYNSATGATWSIKTDLPNVTLQPGQYYLIQEATNAAVGVALPTPDLNGMSAASTSVTGIALAVGAGKVVLANSTVFVTGANPVDAQIVDKVGYGITPTGFEGTGPTGTVLTSTTSAQRLSTGCTDTNNNPTDFVAALPIPRNMATAISVCSSAPSIAITSPANTTIFSPEITTVNVDLSISNFSIPTGKIKYTINGGAAVYKTTHDNVTDKSIAITTSAGQSYTVVTELVDSSNNPLVPAKTATVNFSVATYTNAATLAAVRAAGINAWVNYTGTSVVSFSRPLVGGRNQKYIQDATAGILVDDNLGLITTPFVIGDGISNIKGQLINFNGVMEFVPNQDATKPSTGNTITPQVVSLATIAGNIDAYESQLVQINGVSFTAADGTAVFALNTPTPINDGVAMNFTPIFPTTEVDYIGSVIPTGSRNILVLVSETTGNVARVVARSLAELTLSRNSFDAISGLKIYPNPAKNLLNITSDSFETKTVAIYNVLGAQVLAANITNAPINVASLSKGVYVVKVTEEGKTATRKLVIE